ncbi:MAG: N-acetylmuramoyl-L-alanine amidase [Verrucomicrobiae bacterium]|nr:N-acetylmuramoyl-L-alanine amidase [Verrucomicrobiae bacterium]
MTPPLEMNILEWIIRSSLLVAAIWLALFLVRNRLSAASRFAIWMLALWSVVLVAGAMLAFPQWRLLPNLREPAIYFHATNTDVAPERSSESGTSSMQDELPTKTHPIEPVHTVPWWILAWAGGSTLLACRIGFSLVKLTLLRRRAASLIPDLEPLSENPPAFPRKIDILAGPVRSIPMVWGIFRPCISLPPSAKTWPPQTLLAVLFHEAAHAKRRDPLWLLLTELVFLLCWPNPAVWLVVSHVRRECERAADDLAMADSGIRRSHYATALARVVKEFADLPSRHRRPHVVALAMASRSSRSFESRILAVLDGKRNRYRPTWPFHVSMMALFSLATLFTALAAPAKKSDEASSLTVVLDPGHGGHDNGAWARSPINESSIAEKTLNLMLSDRIGFVLEKSGKAEVAMTRRSDEYLDLATRAEFGERIRGESEGKTVFLSIHHNSSNQQNRSGVQIFAPRGEFSEAIESRRMAQSIKKELETEFEELGIEILESSNTLLRQSSMPRLIVEAGYLSNQAELRRLLDTKSREAFAAAVSRGILSFANSRSATATENQNSETRLTEGFDWPVGAPNMEGFYVTRQAVFPRHPGADFNGRGGGNSDLGAPVQSIGVGKVVLARDLEKGWGNVVVTRHSYRDRETGDIRTIDALYAHLNEIQVTEGEQVKRGQQVGTIGRGPRDMYYAHLHFEIRKNTEWDPRSIHLFPRDQGNYHDPVHFISENRPQAQSEGSVTAPPTASEID